MESHVSGLETFCEQSRDLGLFYYRIKRNLSYYFRCLVLFVICLFYLIANGICYCEQYGCGRRSRPRLTVFPARAYLFTKRKRN